MKTAHTEALAQVGVYKRLVSDSTISGNIAWMSVVDQDMLDGRFTEQFLVKAAGASCNFSVCLCVCVCVSLRSLSEF